MQPTPYVPKYLHFTTTPAKRKTGVCIARCCRNNQGNKTGGLCAKHYRRHRLIVDPLGIRYQQIKDDAKRRRKIFTMSLEWFRKWCVESGYMMKRGCSGKLATIDCIVNKLGYAEGNLQIKSHLANIIKYHGVDKHLTELPPEHEDYVPF